MTLPKKLFHYSKDEIIELKTNFYEDMKDVWPEEGSMKPIGFWISVEESENDYSWFDFSKDTSNCFRECLRHKYAVTLSSDAKILYIKTSDEIRQLTKTFPGKFPYIDTPHSTLVKFTYLINWKNVKELYDGIIISPYQWKCRYEPHCTWYYSWDCASGCIWNLNKISLKLDSLIDIQSLMEPSQEVESEKDSQLVNPVLLV